MVGVPLAFDRITTDVTSAARLGKDFGTFTCRKRLSDKSIAQFDPDFAARSAERSQSSDKLGLGLKGLVGAGGCG
jgi:hypothetical protein